MRNLTSQVYEWLEQGHITRAQANELFRSVLVSPNSLSWQRLLSLLLQWAGALSLVTGIIFFFAYNWQSLDRISKFALIEAALLISLVCFVWLYYRSMLRQVDAHHHLFGATLANVALLVVSMLIGGLLALVGQTYQTGADPWQLFALWALAIIPLAWVAGFDGLWLLLLGLVNLSLGLFADTASYLLDEQIWLFVFAAINLTIYYGFVFMGKSQSNRWHAPLMQYASSLVAMGCFTLLLCWMIFEPSDSKPLLVGVWAGYFIHLLLGFWWFRHRLLQIYPLALGGFSLIAVGAALLTELLFKDSDPIGGFLLIGLYIILASTGLSTVLIRLQRQFSAEMTPISLVGEELSHE